MTQELTRAADALADFEAAVIRVQLTLVDRLTPVLEETARKLRAWYNAYPGMPYTAPSLWDASQMAADR